MKTIKELLVLLLANIDAILMSLDEDGEPDYKTWDGVAGMCDVVEDILYFEKDIIDEYECSILLNYIKDNKPDNTDPAVFLYWWNNDQEGVNKRKEWINKHIELNQEKVV